MAIRVDLTIDQGSTFNFTFSVNDDNNISLDLTGYTSRAEMRRYYTSTNAVSFTTGIANTNALTLSLTAETTAALIAGRYVYDCEIVDGATNNVTRVIEGVATVTPEVTR